MREYLRFREKTHKAAKSISRHLMWSMFDARKTALFASFIKKLHLNLKNFFLSIEKAVIFVYNKVCTH